MVTEHGLEVSGVQFVQLLNVDEPDGVAVSITVVPAPNWPTHAAGPHGTANPAGELVTVPNPGPVKLTVRVTDPLLAKQITLPVIEPVTIVPEEEIPPALVLV